MSLPDDLPGDATDELTPAPPAPPAPPARFDVVPKSERVWNLTALVVQTLATVVMIVLVFAGTEAVDNVDSGVDEVRDLVAEVRAIGVDNRTNTDQTVRIIDKLEECTTAGPRTPTLDDPSTGNECFDRGQAATVAAIGAIVDADGDGVLDAIAVAEALARIEAALAGAP